MMQANGHTVLITGGASGIGLALTEQFIQHGNKVIVVGQNKQKLHALKERYPTISTHACDLRRKDAIQELAAALYERHPTLNILINNAGIQHNYDFINGVEADLIEEEIGINLTAPILLIAELLPLLARQPKSAIINVSSGLGIVPKKSAPVYCGTKAALHIFTKSLRDQLRGSPVQVFEIIPPIVDTAMTRGRGRGKLSPERLAEQFFRDFRHNRLEIAIGKVKILKWLNRWFPSVAEAILRHS
ncbi:SDR family oxidoreductase [Paenibacillus sp. NPDC057967]|uniref:SDR family oxidoreductase n=1 Tax=Paenibacillus sp. NPDC057967 TaxID=3346293 RepID=UPI0036DD7531